MDADDLRLREIPVDLFALTMNQAPESLFLSMSILNDEARRIVCMIETEQMEQRKQSVQGRNDHVSAYEKYEHAFNLLNRAYLEIDGCSRTNISLVLQPLLTNKGLGHLQTSSFTSHHRPVYDEGMLCFPHLLSMEDDILSFDQPSLVSMDSSMALKEAMMFMVLHYNVGQIRTRQRRYSEAYTHFMDAHVILKLVNTSDRTKGQATLWLVRILHNIGYIQYRLGDANASILTYRAAVQALNGYGSISDNTCLGDDKSNECPEKAALTAATLNCLGVLFFHLPRCDIQCVSECFLTTLSLLRQLIAIDSRNDDILVETTSIQGMISLAQLLATALYNIGRVNLVTGTDDLALWSLQKSLEMRRKQFGNDHLDVAATLFNLGQVYQQYLKDYDAALRHYEEFIEIALPEIGFQHHDVAFVYKCMAQVYEKQKNFTLAIEMYHKSLTTYRAIYGLIHLEVASILNKLGHLYYRNQNYILSLVMYEQGVQMEEVLLPPNHPNIPVTISNLAQIHQVLGNLPQSLHWYEKAYAIQKQSGALDLCLATTLSHMAVLQYAQHNYQDSLDLYQEVLRIRRTVHGEEALEVASTWHSLGHVLYQLRCVPMALNSFRHCFQIRCRHLVPTHPDMAVNLYNIATIEMELGHEDIALRYLQEVLWIEHHTCKNGRAAIPTLQRIGQLHQKRGDALDAIHYYQQVVQRLGDKDEEDEACPIHNPRAVHIPHSQPLVGLLQDILHRLAVLNLEAGNGGLYVDYMIQAWRLYKKSDPQPVEGGPCCAHGTCDNDDRARCIAALLDDGSDVMVQSASRCQDCKQGFLCYDLAKLYPECAAMA